MEAQEVFDKVARHLLKQNKRSSHGANVCKYRGPLGTMCAVGCLLPDDLALRADREYYSVAGLRTYGLLPEELKPHVGLLIDLQLIHDDHNVTSWRGCLISVAAQHGLSHAAASS